MASDNIDSKQMGRGRSHFWLKSFNRFQLQMTQENTTIDALTAMTGISMTTCLKRRELISPCFHGFVSSFLSFSEISLMQKACNQNYSIRSSLPQYATISSHLFSHALILYAHMLFLSLLLSSCMHQ
ncbi:hypothetical protein ACOSP7_023294 [Xanthoceras sorbifolium]